MQSLDKEIGGKDRRVKDIWTKLGSPSVTSLWEMILHLPPKKRRCRGVFVPSQSSIHLTKTNRKDLKSNAYCDDVLGCCYCWNVHYFHSCLSRLTCSSSSNVRTFITVWGLLLILSQWRYPKVIPAVLYFFLFKMFAAYQLMYHVIISV